MNNRPFGMSSNPFGQPGSSPFGQQPMGSIPFGQQPTGSIPFGQQPTGSIPFGQQPTGSIPFGQKPTGSIPFGQQAMNSPFVMSSSPFGQQPMGSSPFGQQPGSSSLFGQQPASSNLFGQQPTSSPFGQSTSTPFGQPQMSSLSGQSLGQSGNAVTSIPAANSLGSQTGGSNFGFAPTGSLGQTPTTTPAFGVSPMPAFGSSTPAFGASSTPAFGASSSPFGAFGDTSAPAFGSTMFDSVGSGFGFSTSPAFDSTPAFGSGNSSIFGTSGGQSSSLTFGSTIIGQSTLGHLLGSRVMPFAPTLDIEGAPKFQSISAMPPYSSKSHEELRWQDYERGDKGGANPIGLPSTCVGFSAPQQTNPFGQTSASSFRPMSGGLFGSKPAFGTPSFGQSTPAFCSPFGASSESAFGSSSTISLFGVSSAPALSTSSTPLFASSSIPSFGFSSAAAATTPMFNTSLSFDNTQPAGPFLSSPSIGQMPLFGQTNSVFDQSQTSASSSLFGGQSVAGVFGQSAAGVFGKSAAGFFGQSAGFDGQSAGFVGQSSGFVGQSAGFVGQSAGFVGQSAGFDGQSATFDRQSTGFGGSLFGPSSSLTPSSTQIGLASFSSPFQSSAYAPALSDFSFGNFGQMQPAGFGGTSNISSQSPAPPCASQSNVVYTPAPLVNPFGTLPPAPQLSISRSGGSSSNVYSDMPVSDKSAPVRISSLVTPRHFSRKRIRSSPTRYPSKSNGPRVPFFLPEEEVPTTPKADTVFIPREDPRALAICPIERWPPRLTIEGALKIYNEKALRSQDPSTTLKATEVHADHQIEKVVDSSDATFSGNCVGEAAITREHGADEAAINREHGAADEAAIAYEDGAADEAAIAYEDGADEAAIAYEDGADDIEALMPKLRHPEYYTEPRVEELAAKERATPGFCRHVKDFIVGRHGYGSIKFEGETDVRRLDLEAIVEFNQREVIVYKDGSKKPPLGQGLNKPGEVTLLNVKHVDRKTGHHFTEGPKMESFCKMLKKKAEEQGAKHVSYEPVKGVWKFKVDHF